jgi:hypothetical protein
MFDVLSVAEIDSQHVELLPARNTMVLLDLQGLKLNGYQDGHVHNQAGGSQISLLLCEDG